MTNSQLIIQRIELGAKHLQQALVVTFIVMISALSASFIYLKVYSNHHIRNNLIDFAQHHTTMLSKARSLYQTQVIERENFPPFDRNKTMKKNIPSASTFSRLLSESARFPNMLYRVHSYNASLSETHSLKEDEFIQSAWLQPTNSPDINYYQFEEVGGIESLRYAVAIETDTSCDRCTTTPVLTKIAELTIPVTKFNDRLSRLVTESFFVILMICVIGIITIFNIFKRMRLKVIEVVSTNKELQQLINNSKQTQAKLLDMSLTDALTGISNRRSFDRDLERQWHWSLVIAKANQPRGYFI